ncbi:MAG: trypsin-like peptidase domain-containing protein, partial [Deltaproteobacteria bacterium]|nr:trypsin-like peptidase domain-containing protein [Nannocystaceae bacterium]
MTPHWRAVAVLVYAFAGSRPASAGVYGIDDRHHVYLEDDPRWHDLAARSVIAELRSGWALCDGITIAPTQTLGEYADLCPGEAFEDDPVVTSCSATLIDDDLIVTAHHCIEDGGCATAAFAPGLRFSAKNELAIPGPDDIYTCRRVVAQTDGVDIAIVQLDRPVAGDYVPATLGPTPDEEGAELGVIGFPTYTPMKIARECTVRGLHAGLVRHDCDTFHGNSGSGVFDGDGGLFGVHILVTGDYDMVGDCYVTKVYTQDGHIPGIPSAPQFGAAARIDDLLPVLCESGWPTPLCGTKASCGDGTCSGTETAASCDSDCGPPVCGDAICEVTVELACDEDCGHLTAACPGGESSGGDTEEPSTSTDAAG